jgi:hypothetical protein
MSSVQGKTAGYEHTVVQAPATAVASSAAETPGERLDWQAFTARYFPQRGRHDFEVVKAYEAYRNSPPTEKPGPTAEAEAVQVWEGEGGAVPAAGSKEEAYGNGPSLLG